MKNYILVVFLAIASYGTIVSAGEKSNISVNDKAPYYDKKIIPAKIRKSCTALGSNFSKFTKKFLEKYGYSVTLKPELKKTDKGQNLILEITNASSAGNAFTGHRKSVSIEAVLYQDGKEIDKYSGSRDSGGGFGGGFKGSCSVLDRCVNALGKDIARWLKKRK